MMMIKRPTMNAELLEGGVALVRLTAMTMTPEFFDDLQAVFDKVSGEPAVKSVVLQSEGKAFSYGLDLPAAFAKYGEMFGGGLAGTRSALLDLIGRLQGSLNAVAGCPVPVIAAIHGWCIGGGLDLIAACDIRLASADSRFSLRETRVAIVADLGSLQRLPAIIGKGNLRELAFTGKDIGSARAQAIGLVNETFADRAEVQEKALAMAKEIAGNPPLVVRGVKKVMEFCEGKSVSDGLEYVAAWNSAFLASEDLAEAVSSFIEKRRPEYRGR
jgi:enoyl-CoA hydratase